MLARYDLERCWLVVKDEVEMLLGGCWGLWQVGRAGSV